MRGWIVEAAFGAPGTLVNGYPVLGGLEWLAEHASPTVVVCGIGSPAIRQRLVLGAARLGVTFASLVHPRATVTKRVAIGHGVIITAGCVVTNNIRLGDHVQLNLNTTVGHDAELEDFVTTAPGVHISGNVRLGEGAYLGTGSAILERLAVGPWSVIGAGAVVTRDVPANVTAVGVPAKAVSSREAGWQQRV